MQANALSHIENNTKLHPGCLHTHDLDTANVPQPTWRVIHHQWIRMFWCSLRNACFSCAARAGRQSGACLASLAFFFPPHMLDKAVRLCAQAASVVLAFGDCRRSKSYCRRTLHKWHKPRNHETQTRHHATFA